MGAASGFDDLFLCRLVSGFGVAALSTALTMSIADISTPLNRALSFSPIMVAFTAGGVMGPAVGGVLLDQIGMSPTFYFCGGSFVGLAVMNYFLLDETIRRPRQSFPWQEKSGTSEGEEDQKSIKAAFQDALGHWGPLMKIASIRNACIMNGFYWVALAGGQITLLPLILTDTTGLSFSATQVGQAFMGMGVVSAVASPFCARFIDSTGPVPAIVAGCVMVSSAMFALPLCDPNHLEQLTGVLGLWALGSSFLATAPTALVSNEVDDESQRAQALALARLASDVGMLLGASTVGLLTDWTGGMDGAIQSSSVILATATAWYGVRNLLTARIKTAKHG